MYATRSARGRDRCIWALLTGEFPGWSHQALAHTHRKMKGSLPLEKTSCVVRVVFPINFKGQTPRAKKLTVQGKRDNIKMCPEPREQCVLFAMPPLLGIEEFCDVCCYTVRARWESFSLHFKEEKRCFCVFVCVAKG
jgi:hypothetical protein